MKTSSSRKTDLGNAAAARPAGAASGVASGPPAVSSEEPSPLAAEEKVVPEPEPARGRKGLGKRPKLDLRSTGRASRRLLSLLVQPQTFAVVFLAASGLYCFAIGRDRYQTVSEFVIRQPSAASAISATLINPALSSPTVQGSLEDGRFLQIYLGSPEVMTRLYPNPDTLQRLYAPRPHDPWSGLPASANRDQQLAFFQRQTRVIPQELSGSIQLTTTGYTAQQALSLNQAMLQQAQKFVNQVNQSISDNQRIFAEQEVERARLRLSKATAALNAFEDRHGQLDPTQERTVASSFIAALESRLVDLKVQEASLRRQYRDPQAPEVATVSDQVVELERQIRDERRKAVSPGGRDLNKLSTQAQSLQSEVAYATETLKAAMVTADSRRMESERQLKYLVMLRQAELPAQPDNNWRWKVFLASVGALFVVWGVGGFLVGVVKRT